MDKIQKIQFITELLENVKEELIRDVPRMPEDWDGLELRWLIKERFNQCVFGGHKDRRERRHRDFDNFCIVNNL